MLNKINYNCDCEMNVINPRDFSQTETVNTSKIFTLVINDNQILAFVEGS